MNNLEYVKKRYRGSSLSFSEAAKTVYDMRLRECAYSKGNIVDWLAEEYCDSALDYPVGTLIQWDDDIGSSSSGRKNIYGVVTGHETRENALSLLIIDTVDERNNTEKKYLWLETAHVRKADIPSSLVTVLCGSVNRIHGDDK